MLQRIQSVWLLLAAIFLFLSFRFPFYSGNTAEKAGVKFTAGYNFLTLVLTAILAAGCLAIIFLYKNRKLQLRLTIAALLVSIAILAVYFAGLRDFVSGELSFSAIFIFLVPVLLLLAGRGIYKDEKLVRSLDRLR